MQSMDKTGLLSSIFDSIDLDHHGYMAMRQSDAGLEYTRSLKTTLQITREVSKKNDIDLFLASEELFLQRELELYGKEDPSVRPSLNAALTDLSVMKDSLETAKDPEYYKAADATYHIKKKERGVPKDGFHEAVNGHVTRLGNRMSALGISIPEKNILRQRQENMRQAKKLYMDLQRKALGLPLETDRGLER